MTVAKVTTARRLQAARGLWLAAGAVLAVAVAACLGALHLLFAAPTPLMPWLALSVVPLVAGAVGAVVPALSTYGAIALREASIAASLLVLVFAVYVLVVVGLGEPVADDERRLLVMSMIAAALVALLALPVRARVSAAVARLTESAQVPAAHVLHNIQARMTRAVPMDELLLSLAEQLRGTLDCSSVDIHTGIGGRYPLAVAVPRNPRDAITLDENSRAVVGRTRLGARRWAEVWLPMLSPATSDAIRVAPLSHQGELLGMIVARRAVDFDEEEERVLVELARQLALALHNSQLDSALQESLVALELRNDELRASRQRVVTASNETRRAIERNLHDGAQQHLVALAVKIGLVEQLVAGGDSTTARLLLEQLRGDVQETVREVRELAHGIYPPLLRDRGLPEALRAAAARCPLAVDVAAEVGRHAADTEAAVYFCCVEALHNAGKYAGAAATVRLTVHEEGGEIRFEIVDDGRGFDGGDAGMTSGHGFTNMNDRLGALGGELVVTSRPGEGVRVHGRVPSRAETS